LFYLIATFLVFIAFLVGVWAQGKSKANFYRYLAVKNSARKSGAQVAGEILKQNGIRDVTIGFSNGGDMSDRYDSRNKNIELTDKIYNAQTISSMCVSAREACRAVMHSEGYAPFEVFDAILPVLHVGSVLSSIVFFYGLRDMLRFGTTALIDVGILMFFVYDMFVLISLPIELEASRRALDILTDNDYLNPNEYDAAKNALNAASLNCLATMITVFSIVFKAYIEKMGRRYFGWRRRKGWW
jgi:Zn-dependent membrane protease YugP